MGASLCYPSDKTYSVNGAKYTVNRVLGEGGFSFVYLVKDSNSRKYALKVMICQTNESINTAKREINIFKTFNHPNIMKLVDHSSSQYSQDGKQYLLLLPYYKDGSLQDLIDNQRIVHGKHTTKPLFDEKTLLIFFKKICEAIQVFHTHEPPLAHRDIKPGNILLANSNDGILNPILTDFGSVKEARIKISNRKEALSFQDEVEQNTTPFYKAPELFDIASDCVIDERIDVWSLGCLLYTAAYNRSPFEVSDDEPSGSVALKVLSGLPSPFPSTNYSNEFNQLIRNMVNLNKDDRLHINQIITEIENILSKN
ncbi:hypothetical protein DICPUDRAFT_78515 [Dictyostelium purpureum]|uniref:non-specific serine/threonine protein kinase n=1 Tax=Dictyostelium purpureum TaxID=5786 RepID=F0ZJS6_DICPU|nr:uncharacterized protein DICPUDRAFT_78515 [Dictyostelium purpureum]EGC35791.1 hypothetical protein DICPUDRAFT_78515 [Dictyostelium purpureum]|eukprot:XP_003287685.1 hypothetical protein DICPUDRAFT_78515 [Dictyostelium purpureum]